MKLNYYRPFIVNDFCKFLEKSHFTGDRYLSLWPTFLYGLQQRSPHARTIGQFGVARVSGLYGDRRCSDSS